jgi:hypothetical protein
MTHLKTLRDFHGHRVYIKRKRKAAKKVFKAIRREEES